MSFLPAMEEAAIEAGKELLKLQPNAKRLDSRKDFLADADEISDDIIKRVLEFHWPQVYYWSEESENDDGINGPHWKVDPVDGTVNYFMGETHWAVSIAYVEGGETKAAFLYLPAEGLLAWATIDSPSQARLFDGTPVELDARDEDTLADSQFCFEWGKYEVGSTEDHLVHSTLHKLKDKSIYPKLKGSAAASVLDVPRKLASGFCMPLPDPFDVAAAGLIARQAGCMVTDINGNLWTATSTSILVTNGKIHDETIRVINQP